MALERAIDKGGENFVKGERSSGEPSARHFRGGRKREKLMHASWKSFAKVSTRRRGQERGPGAKISTFPILENVRGGKKFKHSRGKGSTRIPGAREEGPT